MSAAMAIDIPSAPTARARQDAMGDSDTAILGMNDDLVHWGKVLLQMAKGTEPDARDDRPPIPKRIWDAKEEREAWDTDQLVRRLPPRDQAILRTYYKAREAEWWHELSPLEQAAIEADLCREFNYRWRIYCAEVQILPVALRGYHFGPLRIAAVRALAAMDGR